MHKTPIAPISKNRLILGGAIFIVGFFSPLLVPVVIAAELSTELTVLMSGLLMLGIPEITMLVSVAILGSDGYQVLKEKCWVILKKTAPIDEVSRSRYITGLVLFTIPLIYAWLEPYIVDLNPWLQNNRMIFNVSGDLLFVTSLYVLGGNFWDKLRALFQYNAKAQFPEKEDKPHEQT